MGFPILVRWHLFIESGTWTILASAPSELLTHWLLVKWSKCLTISHLSFWMRKFEFLNKMFIQRCKCTCCCMCISYREPIGVFAVFQMSMSILMWPQLRPESLASLNFIPSGGRVTGAIVHQSPELSISPGGQYLDYHPGTFSSLSLQFFWRSGLHGFHFQMYWWVSTRKT